MASILLTGANRGIGLAFAKLIAERGDTLFATCRNPDQAKALRAIADSHPSSVHLIALDVDDDDSIQMAFDKISTATDKLDLLINNAGIGSGPEQLGQIERAHLQKFFNTNSTSPLMVAQAFLPLLEKSKGSWIVNISSILGSIGSTPPPIEWSSFAYRTSKAAVNMVTRTLASFLQEKKIGVISFHPGWVKTDMGGPQAPLSPEESASKLLHQFSNLRSDQSGCYLDPDGNTLPW
jgi:NAD(P)-dependent dehydrogenase (short-subunit alcohol dehydrogenase family)